MLNPAQKYLHYFSVNYVIMLIKVKRYLGINRNMLLLYYLHVVIKSINGALEQ